PDAPAIGAPQKQASHQRRQDRGDHEPREGLAQGYFGAIGDAHGRQYPNESEHQLFAFLTRSSTTVGSARVEVSPREPMSPSAIFLRMRRMILPERVLGRPGANWITSGLAMGPISWPTNWRSSSAR